MRRLSLHIAMFALLVFAQQQSIAHQILHAAQNSSQQDPSRDNNKSCDKCLALAHLGDSLPSSQHIFVAQHASLHRATAPDIVELNCAFIAYRSRAPPSIS